MNRILNFLFWNLFSFYLLNALDIKAKSCQLLSGGGCRTGNCCPEEPPKCCDPSCPKCIGGKAPKRGSGCLSGCPLGGCCPGFCPCDDCVCCYTSTNFVTETFTSVCEKTISTTTTKTSSRTIYTTEIVTSIIPLTFTVEELFTYRSVTTILTYPFGPYLTTEILSTERVQSASTIYISTSVVNEFTTTKTTNTVTITTQPIFTAVVFVSQLTLETDQQTFLPTTMSMNQVTLYTQVVFSTIVISNILESSLIFPTSSDSSTSTDTTSTSSTGSTSSATSSSSTSSSTSTSSSSTLLVPLFKLLDTGNISDGPILKSAIMFESNVALDINTVFRRTIVQTYFNIYTVSEPSVFPTTLLSAPSYYTVPVFPLSISATTMTTLTEYQISGLATTPIYQSLPAYVLGRGTDYRFVYPEDSFTINSSTISTYLCTTKDLYNKCVLDMVTETQTIDLIPTQSLITGTTQTKVYVPIDIITEFTTDGVIIATETLSIDPFILRA